MAKRRFLRLNRGEVGSLPRHLATVINALDGRAVGGRLRSDEAVRALQSAFGNDYRKYVHDVLAPPLVSRGLLIRDERRALGFIPYIHYERTTAGEAKIARLSRLIEEAGGMKKLLRSDPDRAVRIAQMAGVLLVLSPGAKAQIPKLKALMAERAGDGGTTATYDGSDDDGGWQLDIDLGALDFSADLVGMLDGIDSVGDFTGDSGGDGGDGGGGD